jgi:regulator of protease activity HflC (stomatin/prohibitin superfamily)
MVHQTKKINTIINIVPQQEAWIIERFGRYYEFRHVVSTILICSANENLMALNLLHTVHWMLVCTF